MSVLRGERPRVEPTFVWVDPAGRHHERYADACWRCKGCKRVRLGLAEGCEEHPRMADWIAWDIGMARWFEERREWLRDFLVRERAKRQKRRRRA